MTRVKFVLISFLFFLLAKILLAQKKIILILENFFFDKKLDKSKFKFEQDIVFNPKNEKILFYLAKIYDLEK